jgi:hypothetical protein
MHRTDVDHLTSACSQVSCDYVTVLSVELVTLLSAVDLATL